MQEQQEQQNVPPEEIIEALLTVFYHKAMRIKNDQNTNSQGKKTALQDLIKQLQTFMTKVTVTTGPGDLDFTACYNQYYAGCPMGTTPCNENEFWSCISNSCMLY